MPQTLVDIIAAQPNDAVAIVGPDGETLTYEMLGRRLDATGAMLRRAGISRGDRVVCVLSDSAEAAVALLAVASAAVCVPLHPSCGADEFDVYLGEVLAKAILIDGSESSVRSVAQRRGMPIVEIGRRNGAVDVIAPLPDATRTAVPTVVPSPGDTAIVFRTSGTTGRPKRVPLTHAMLCVRAFLAYESNAGSQVSAEDRCLNLMPLCYYAGFYTLLTALAAGGSIAWPQSLDPDAFFAALEVFRPSWYAATPTVHSAIVAHAARYADLIARYPLRFIRSATAELAPPLWADLERVFNAPVVSTYATTETSRVCMNALPPGLHKAGSLGRCVPGSVGILDAQGYLVPVGAEGEIGVRGPTVFTGYEDDPEATRAAFVHGWFRTGDSGRIDADGFLFLTDRIKDVINRGGTKISPHAVEMVLLAHPAVAAAAVFGMPHATLGEDVVAAVVPRSGSAVTERDLRAFAAARLSAFETPDRVLLVERIPTSAVGKVQRRMLAQQLAPLLTVQHEMPATDLDRAIAEVWTRELRVPTSLHDNFFALGGDSLTAVRVVSEVSRMFRTALPVNTLLQASTVAQMADLIRQGDRLPPWSSLVPIQAGRGRPPLFCVHGAQGNILDFRELAQHLGSDQPVYGLQSQGLDGVLAPYTRIEDMAAHYLREIEAVASHGPEFLCGFSMGGIVALEMARQLHAAGRRVALLAMLDTRLNRLASLPGLTTGQQIVFHVRHCGEAGLRLARNSAADGAKYLLPGTVADTRRSTLGRPDQRDPGPDVPAIMRRIEELNVRATKHYRPQVYPGKIVVYLAKDAVWSSRYASLLGWRYLAGGGLDIAVIPGDHDCFLSAPAELAANLRARIDQILETSRMSHPAVAHHERAAGIASEGRA